MIKIGIRPRDLLPFIKAEASRRILERYPLGKQATLADGGPSPALDAMRTYRDAVIAVSHELEAAPRHDFADDKWWPQ